MSTGLDAEDRQFAVRPADGKLRVYLVEDTGNTPGRILGVFLRETDAFGYAMTIGDAEYHERIVHEEMPHTGRELP
jgi:hypothetical protein